MPAVVMAATCGLPGGAVTETISVTASGTYTVTVNNASGNKGMATIAVTADSVKANAGSNQALCSGNSTTINATGGISYLWSPGTGLSSTTGATVTASPTLSVTYSLTVTDGYGCIGTSSVQVAVQSSLVLNAGQNVTICVGSTTVLSASGGSNYTWNPSSGLSSATVINPTAGPTATTTYSLTATSTCPVTPTTVMVSVISLPVLTVSSNTSICYGNTADLSAGGAVNYLWMPSAGLNTSVGTAVTSSPVASTNYTVTGTAASGCANTAGVTVTINALPTAVISGNLTTCSGTSTLLTATGGSMYQWSTGATTQSVSISTAGSLTVTAINVNGCMKSTSAVVAVDVPPTLLIFPPSASICITSPDSAGLLVMVAGTIKWSPASGLAASTSPGDRVVNFLPTVTTVYTATDVDANGCSSASTQITITVYNVPTISVSGVSTICKNNTTDLTASGASSYSWTPSASLNSAMGASVTASPTTTTTYTVTGTNSSCSGTTSATVVVNLCTGIEEEVLNNSFQVYPNPTNGNLTVTFNTSKANDVIIRLTDMKGNEVYRESKNQINGEYKTTIDLSNQAKGIYLVTLITGEGVVNSKIIVE